MRKINIKSGMIILVYSLVISVLLFIGILVFKNNIYSLNDKITSSNSKFIIIADEDYNDIFTENVYEKSIDKINILRDNKVFDFKEIINIYLKQGCDKLLMIIFVLFCIFMVSSIILWKILNAIHDKEIEIIINNLNKLDEKFDPYQISKSFGIYYESIREKYENNLEDYKRLNSYLSHEQKNLLSILKTKLEIDRRREYIDLVDDISSSIDDVLTLSDIRNEKDLEKVDVLLICAKVCDLYSKAYDKINFDFDENSNTTILAKERWLYSAISNLVDNAIKYGNNKEINISVKTRYESVIIEIKDNGIGMDRSCIDKIFDDKYRINNIKKDGYGIGLNLVSHVCNLCNGFVFVDSEIGKGSCFYLSFSQYEEM